MNGSLSEHKAGKRRFTLYLPPSYSPGSRAFPAVYVQDGSSLFQDQIELLESAFQQRRLPELVLIGIKPENRLNEYTPWPAASLSDRFPDFGGMGYHYLSDITNQFIPLIEENWNVIREPQSRGMIGASLGGLISMFALLKYPSVFGKIGSISGSYWYENAPETVHLSSLKPGTSSVFMSVGSNEGREKQSIQRNMLQNTKQVHQSLKEKGFTEEQLCLSIEKGAVHHRKYFCKQFIIALKWLYGKNRSTL
ncbi:alpha/beta hydrolase-fold protein [Bacillus inaquosorum]|uniref:alpha/beta hydrolase n=1 Tax=Bacillus inaquosorum TaxID=483913 RepID=UPI00227F3417|nr:alpha/beta hydrolase-fold protein [Bacillus inaquosorum]MCY8376417.1 alpha/beta hydrolase-fold protein [Bacillus inaquosorum]MCY9012355.1 alpha/beta hydrolase-fold protein [Bacillus inaquosorum]MCY9040934.1 alpha/beta hydrolase-fold protein [Bacillus inaquosorum]MCY9095512.1 alpha/beta hydrolase-fold protein [Bacillus inaquosorum]MCY9101917.1 alpha/beta hydrolase-fold protein [Bacillus inaquosorum]